MRKQKFTEHLLCSTYYYRCWEYSSGKSRQKSLPCGVYIRKGWNGQTVSKINADYYDTKNATEKIKEKKGRGTIISEAQQQQPWEKGE